MSIEKCDPQTIVDSLEAIDNNEDKVNYVMNVLDTCGLQDITPPQVSSSVPKPVKEKRQMSGYNCFVKQSVAGGANFKELIKAKTWSQLSDRQKMIWNERAKQGCPRIH